MQTPIAQTMLRVTMPPGRIRAYTILGEFERAQSELVGKAVILTDGKAGTVESIWLDEIAWPANLCQGPCWEVAYLDGQVRADGLSRLHRLACHLDRRQTDKSC
jgi:hypothetical protein